MNKGLIHIYTGNGKGKTSAVVGLAIRAHAHGLRVCYRYFHKKPEKYGRCELDLLSEIGIDVEGIAKEHPRFDENVDVNRLKFELEEGMGDLDEHISKFKFDLLIIDEIINTVRHDFLPEERLIQFLKEKPASLEIAMTGRGASDKLIGIADYVSDIEKVKHPFDERIRARKGIEF